MAASINRSRVFARADARVSERTRPLVLVTDDDADTRELFRTMLGLRGFAVIEASDGEQAVSLAESERPDLILMDLHLPVLDGVEAACLLREHGEFNDVPIVAITAHDSADSRADAADCGFDEYVTKPIDFDHLEPLIDRLLKAV